MQLCIPVDEDRGTDSPVCAHFGSAPLFAFVDTDTLVVRCKENASEHHEHGMCRPLAKLQGERVDALVVGGIGPGALERLQAAGIQVFRSGFATVGETVEALREGRLGEVDPKSACDHGHGAGRAGGGCGHGRGAA